MPTPSLAQLISAWLERSDQAAAGELFRQMQPAVRRSIARFPTLRDEADDLAQQITARAFGALAQFEASRPLDPWLSALAGRFCLSRLRSAERRRADQVESTAEKWSDPTAAPDASLMGRELVRDLRAKVARLPRADRELIEWTHFEGRSTQETAARLGCAPSALKVRVHRARTRLRALFRGQEWPEMPGRRA